MSFVIDSAPIPNGNVVGQHLPIDTVHMRKNKDISRHAPCNCCPYGYHIDLDFVRYCEALSQGSEISANKQRRRERRRQRQSMEVLLGLTSPSVWSLEQQIPQVPVELPTTPVAQDPARTNAMVRDALHKAVLDFEETLQRSHPKSLVTSSLPICIPEQPIPEEIAETDGPGSTLRRAESVSSVSSMSASSSVTQGHANGQPVANHTASHEDAALQDFDVASVGSATSGLSAGALHNIREQMAISLERMRELEEQVKLIPVLQVQLAVLKEEKRQMLLQLRLEEAERNKRNAESDLPAGDGNNITSAETSTRVRSQSCSEGSERNYLHSPHCKTIRSNLRDVGVSCTVVTREVGISPQRPRLRNAKTLTRPILSQLGLSGVKVEEITPDVAISQDTSMRPLTPVHKRLVKVSPVNINIESVLKKPTTKTSACNTDLLMGNVFSDIDMDQNINKTIQLYEKSFSSRLNSQNTRNMGVQIKMPEIAPVLLIIEKRDVGVQFDDAHFRRVIATQTEDASQRLVDVGILAKPRNIDIGLEIRPKTREIATSDHSISDVFCEKCKVKKRSIGVGHHFSNLQIEDDTIISLSNLGIMQNKNSELITQTNKQINTRTIGCGTTICHSVNKGTDTEDINLGKCRDFGVNTTKRKLVDAAVGDVSNLEKSVSSISVCDKCDAAIQNVAKDMLTQSTEKVATPSPSVAVIVTPPTSAVKISPSITPSRIPRPATSVTSHRGTIVTPTMPTSSPSQATANDKRRIQRQDTYTKLQINTEKIQKCRQALTTEALRSEISTTCPAERILAMQASGSREKTEERKEERGRDSSCSEPEEVEEESPLDETRTIMDTGLFQPIQQDTRKKTEPSKEMKAALKVLNDYLKKTPFTTVPHHLKNATNIVQQEWFKISSTASANPLDVEDYLDCFEEMSSTLLEYIVNMTDMSGNTAMHYAVSHGNFDVVSILLDSKVCNINRPNAAGYTCVMLVSLAQVRSETHRQVIRRLFQLADVNVRAKQHGQTALMLAVSHGRLDMVRLLVEAGADMNIQDEDGSTALMCAAEHGHTAIVKHLLSQPDCDASIVDCDGSTALNIAMDAGNKDIGVLLYAHEHFSRGSSPYTSLRPKRSKSATPTKLPGTPPSPSPVRERASRHEQAM